MEHGLRGTFPLDLDYTTFVQFPISAALVPVLQSFIFILFNYRSHRKKKKPGRQQVQHRLPHIENIQYDLRADWKQNDETEYTHISRTWRLSEKRDDKTNKKMGRLKKKFIRRLPTDQGAKGSLRNKGREPTGSGPRGYPSRPRPALVLFL